MTPPVREKEITVRGQKTGVTPPVEELIHTPPIQLPGERLKAGEEIKVDGPGVTEKKAVVISPTLAVIGTRTNVLMFNAASVKSMSKAA